MTGRVRRGLRRWIGTWWSSWWLERRPAVLHVANSAAALADRRFAFDLVRPGVFLYGGSPGEGFPEPAPVIPGIRPDVSARMWSVSALLVLQLPE